MKKINENNVNTYYYKEGKKGKHKIKTWTLQNGKERKN